MRFALSPDSMISFSMNNSRKRIMNLGCLALILPLLCGLATSVSAQEEETVEAIPTVQVDLGRPVDFEEDVLPIIEDKCLACHNAAIAEGRLNLEEFEGLVKGGKSGSPLKASSSKDSLIVKLTSRSTEPAMPPIPNNVAADPLTPEELAILRLWIDEGAKGPDGSRSETTLDWHPLPPGVNPIYATALTPDGHYVAASRANQIFVYRVASGKMITRLSDPSLNELEIYKDKQGIAHLDLVQSLTFSPNGLLLASGGYRVVKLWQRPDYNSPAETYTGGFQSFSTVAVSSDGQRVAAAGKDQVIRIWDRKQGRLIKTLVGHQNSVTKIFFTADNHGLISSGNDGSIHQWDLKSGAITGTITTPAGIHDMTLNHAKTLLATANADQVIRTWNLPSMAPSARVLAVHEGTPGVLASSSDGRWVAVGGSDNLIHLIDTNSGSVLHSFSGHSGSIRHLSFSNDPLLLASTSDDHTIRVWNLPDGKVKMAYSGNQSTPVSATISSDGKYLVSGHENGSLKKWHLEVASPVSFSGDNGAGAHRITVSPDGKWYATSGSRRGVPAINLWDSATQSLIRSFIGHAGEITSIAFSSNGKRIISGSSDRTARIWDSENGRSLRTIPEQPAAITAVALNQDGTLAVTGSLSHEIRIWAHDGTSRVLTSHSGLISGLHILPGDTKLISGSADGHLKIWDMASATPLLSMDHGNAISALSVTTDGNTLVTGGQKGIVKIWNTSDGALIHTLQNGESAVSATHISLDNSRLISGTKDNQISVWDLPSGTLLENLTSGVHGLHSVSFSNDSHAIIISTDDGSIRRVNLHFHEVLPSHSTSIIGVAFQQSEQVLSASEDGMVRLFDTVKHKPLWNTQHGKPIHAMASSPDGKTFATAGSDKLIKRFNMSDGQLLENGTLQGHQMAVTALSYQQESPHRLISGSADHSVILWNQLGTVMQVFRQHTGTINAVVSAGNTLLSSSSDRHVRQFTPSVRSVLKGHEDTITSINFFPEGRRVLSTSKDKTAKIWDLENGTVLTTIDHGGPILSAAIRNDGERIATGGTEGSARLWNAVDGSKISDLEGHTGSVNSLSFSSDGTRLISGSEDRTLRNWDAGNGIPGEVISEAGSQVQAADFTPDSQFVISAGTGNQVHLFNLSQEWTFLGRLGPDDPNSTDLFAPSSIPDRVLSLDFNPDGTLLATGSGEPSRSGTIQIWNLEERTLFRDFGEPHTDTVFSLDFSRDNKFLASSGADKFVKVWDISTGRMVRSFEGHTNHVLGVSWRHDGKHLASCGAQGGGAGGIPGDIKIWNFESGEQVRTITLGKQVTAISYVGDTDEIVTACGDKNARRHRTNNGQQRFVFGGATDFLYAISITSDGELIAAGGQDSVLRIWNGNADNKLFISIEPPQ